MAQAFWGGRGGWFFFFLGWGVVWACVLGVSAAGVRGFLFLPWFLGRVLGTLRLGREWRLPVGRPLLFVYLTWPFPGGGCRASGDTIERKRVWRLAACSLFEQGAR